MSWLNRKSTQSSWWSRFFSLQPSHLLYPFQSGIQPREGANDPWIILWGLAERSWVVWHSDSRIKSAHTWPLPMKELFLSPPPLPMTPFPMFPTACGKHWIPTLLAGSEKACPPQTMLHVHSVQVCLMAHGDGSPPSNQKDLFEIMTILSKLYGC